MSRRGISAGDFLIQTIFYIFSAPADDELRKCRFCRVGKKIRNNAGKKNSPNAFYLTIGGVEKVKPRAAEGIAGEKSDRH